LDLLVGFLLLIYDYIYLKNDQYNSQFDNALQLPLSNIDGSYWLIFDMLDFQPFRMSIDLINSPVKCEDIRVQQNRRTVLPISLTIDNCTLSSDNITTLCLHGPARIKNQVNILHELDVCTLFYTENQTIVFFQINYFLKKMVNI
jgi:hypothetical protein